MSLMRLLTSGKSLVGLETVESRYRMRSRHLLPKFGSSKNPFAAPAPNSQSQAAEPSAEPTLTPEEVAAANLKETRRLPSASPAPSDTPAPAAEKTSKISGLLDWLGQQPGRLKAKLFPAREGKRKSEPKSAIPRFDQPPVQGELSLDNIKVKCNDLSDTDVEVVPVRSAPAPKANVRSTVRAGGNLELAGSQSM
jgi:hypothetical protein